jgi:hypothetical protein
MFVQCGHSCPPMSEPSPAVRAPLALRATIPARAALKGNSFSHAEITPGLGICMNRSRLRVTNRTPPEITHLFGNNRRLTLIYNVRCMGSSDLDQALQFARHNFDNHQALIRASDTKAGVMVTVMVFLAASAFQVGKDAIGKLHAYPYSTLIWSAIFVLACAGLLVAVLSAFAVVLRVIQPRGTRYTAPQKGRDLLWQEHVLLYPTNEDYFSAVKQASPELLLRNFTDQVFELAHISKEKMDALANTRWIFWLAFWSWAVCVAAGLNLSTYQ